jgi:MFS family permease
MAEQGNNNPASEASVAELVRQLSDQTTLLARQEVALAKVELAEKGKRAGLGAGMFGGAGLAGAYAVGAFVAAAILGLATAVDGWLAAVIVGLVLAAVAGVLALVGKNRVQEATPPLPEEAISSAKQDVETVKARAQEGRR